MKPSRIQNFNKILKTIQVSKQKVLQNKRLIPLLRAMFGNNSLIIFSRSKLIDEIMIQNRRQCLGYLFKKGYIV